MSSKKINLLNDVYYSDEYISLYLNDGDKLFNFEYREGINCFSNKTIKRPIKKIGKTLVDDGYFDLEGAYGYGGYYTNCDDQYFLKRALDAYSSKCKEEKIIAEFIRFHPFNYFPIKHNRFLNFNIHDRDVVIVDLEKDILSSYPKKVRYIVKKSSEKVTVNKSRDIDKFIDIYKKTMKKNKAREFYYFDKHYFKQLYLLPDAYLYEVVFNGEIIAMGFFIFSENICHYHLSSNSNISYTINSNYALLNNVFNVAKKMNKQYVLLGGGLTTEVDDPLLKFKKKFSKEVKPFYISGNIFNKEIYYKYNTKWLNQSELDINLFLKYRADLL